MTAITCYIYRCSARADMYLYLQEKDDFEVIPDELSKNLGQLEFAMELELNEDRKLARENPLTVINNLKKQRFHLQMPPETPIDQLLEKIAKETLNQQDK